MLECVLYTVYCKYPYTCLSNTFLYIHLIYTDT